MSIVPTIGEPLVGWRAWRLTRRYGQLVLVSQACTPTGRDGGGWSRTVSASSSCPRRRLRRERPCTCTGMRPAPGTRVIRRTPRRWSSRGPARPGTRAGSLWGVVVPHKNGWRAQYAYPRELVLRKGLQPDDDLELLALELEHAYGVPVRVEVLRKPGVEAKP